tara:strand:- start:1798 stop:2313 length:516 start_codon:yes stop_codon:yes gene_type:complete
MTTVYRYKFNQDIIELVQHFAKLHQYDDRKEYKEAWQEYIETHKDQIEREKTRLSNLGYEGNVYDKMFKSGRYYYRKKPATKPKPKERRKYISLEENVLEVIYRFIRDEGLQLKPAVGYERFCEANKELIKTEVDRLKVGDTLSEEDILLKLKKSYKNQYFNMREKDNSNI